MSQHLMVGYGTLLYQESLGHTIGQEEAKAKPMRPVLVPGYRRLFNLRPTHYESSFELSDLGNEDAAMNVEPAPGCELNGLAFTVDDEELAELDERERYYRRLPAPLLDFFSREEIGKGYVYCAEPDAPWIERDPDRLLPLWRDLVIARQGARAIHPDFGATFDRTTYLADGTTLAVDHYRHLLDRPMRIPT